MITTKQERCARWCWAYVTKYPSLRASELMGATTDYDAVMVARALADLVAGGQLRRELNNARGGYVYSALVPFVLTAPAWVAR